MAGRFTVTVRDGECLCIARGKSAVRMSPELGKVLEAADLTIERLDAILEDTSLPRRAEQALIHACNNLDRTLSPFLPA